MRREGDPDRARLTLTMSSTGIPSVMQMTSGNLRLDRFANRVCSSGRRHIDHAGIAIRFRLGLGNRIEDRQPEMRAAALSRRSPANHLRAVSDGLIGMERAVLAGEALTNHSGVLVDEDRHSSKPALSGCPDRIDDLLRGVIEIVRGGDVQIGRRDNLLAALHVRALEPHDQRHAQADIALPPPPLLPR